ncbi:amylo-alpha-1,6-glucosidase [Allosphingosinicella flava]|uniref:Amylo-alpha-1,6-glucosidase n=1 Tax=Allosphingosinicella flava TaxID=2771430 RepID=A0A7T2LLF2_9SPHN|nr:amylo-alpha-1,6-glucosidase [Sphingosinicella flava]QPQ54369.1 amylo-alpha-1,6-glucosidase [Sphingosinicella flava]
MVDEGGARTHGIDAIEVKPEEYYIEAEQSLVDRPLRTLKRDKLFGVFDIDGDFKSTAGKGPEGIYFLDTRFLSQMRLLIGGCPPLLLDSVVLEDNAALLVDLTNADLHDERGRVGIPRGTIFVNRAKFLLGQHCYEMINVRNYGADAQDVRIDLSFAADFADLFEIRGERRKRRGVTGIERVSDADVAIRYHGLDGVMRRTSISFHPTPDGLNGHEAYWTIPVQAGGKATITITVTCSLGEKEPDKPPIMAAYRQLRRTIPQSSLVGSLSSSNPLFNEVIQRAGFDLDMLLTDTGHGLYPYAGVPWYSTVFGRDGIISAMLVLPQAPEVARGVLLTLAALQATETDGAADSQPGKILHEMRAGEMAQLGEVPFRRYYGTVDATPLFVMLAGDYHRRTGDLSTIRALWPHIEAAIRWIDNHGDADGDGFVEYCRMTEQGLSNQGWKDSHDAIFHADGQLAEGAIALCEVQGYVFAAKRAAADLARSLGRDGQALRWDQQAEALRALFEEKFWLDDLQTYALALDGRKQPCRVRASNAGHALFTGIASPQRANFVVQQLTDRSFFSGWGVRTVAAGEARYNPMSYHNGSVWPHDNAIIALGFARYGHRREAARIFEGLFAAATFDELRRLPELFCGFRRRLRRGPTAYPVACSPQAWAAATPFALASACIGLEIDEARDCVRLDAPTLPGFLNILSLPRIKVGKSELSLRLERHGEDVTVAVSGRSGPVQVMIVK